MKPSITGLWFIAWKTKGQLKAGLMSTMCRNISDQHGDAPRWRPSARSGGPAPRRSCPGRSSALRRVGVLMSVTG